MSDQKFRVSGFYPPGWSSVDRPSPLLMLVGAWLEKAGFAPGDEVRVRGQDGRLEVVRRELDDDQSSWEGR